MKTSKTTAVTATTVINKNVLPFSVNRDEFKKLYKLFNTLYQLKNNEVNTLCRIDLWNDIYNSRLVLWQSLDIDKYSKATPFGLIRRYIVDEIDMIIAKRVTNAALQEGDAVALKIKESDRTGFNTFFISEYLPIKPGNAKMVKSLAKKQTANGKLFAVKERTKDGVTLTVYRVSVKESLNEAGKVVKTKIATKESKSIQRYSENENAFKKGIVAALNAAI